MFKPDLCKLCGKCLTECQWMDVTHAQAITYRKEMMEGKHTPVIDNCITCFACKEKCPTGANPCDQNFELQEKYNTLVPKEVIRAEEKNYFFDRALNPFPKADRILTTCSYEKSHSHLMEGELYDLPRVGGKPFLCWATFPHMGAASIQRNNLKTLVDRLAMTKAKEVVCFHADCYSALASTAPDCGIDVPFKPIHLAEYIVDFLKENKDRIKPLSIDIAYQRPCTSRHSPDKEIFIDTLFDLVGVKRVKRKYDRKNALCCTSVKVLYDKGDDAISREKNILDAKNSGAKAIIYFCPVCKETLADTANAHSLPLIFLGDLARASLGEIDLRV